MKARKTRSFFNVRRAETQARCNIQTLSLCSLESVTRHLVAWGFHKNLLYREGKRALSPRSQSKMLEFPYFSNAQSRTHTQNTIVCIGGCKHLHQNFRVSERWKHQVDPTFSPTFPKVPTKVKLLNLLV